MKSNFQKLPPLVSIIILNYNGKQYLNNCISSVLDSNYSRLEIIVVDNNSNDGSVDAVREQFQTNNIKILRLTKNYGFSEGNNLGSQLATGNYLFFLNNDTIIDEDCIEKLVKLMESDPKIGAAQAKLLSIDGKKIDSAGCFFDRLGFVYVRGFGELDNNQYDQTSEILYAKGAAIIVKRDLWEKLRGFDPLFFMYFEEADFCWRVWLSGFKVIFNPYAKVNHIGMATLKKYSNPLIFQEARNRLVMLMKNYENKNFFKYVPITTIVYFLNFLRYIKQTDIVNAVSIIKSIIWVFLNFKHILKKRLEVQFYFRTVADSYLFQNLFSTKFIALSNISFFKK